MREQLVDVAEIARILGVPKSWVYTQTARRAIPHLKLGHYVRFHVPTVLAWAVHSGDGIGESHRV